jgi:hypothetical protein
MKHFLAGSLGVIYVGLILLVWYKCTYDIAVPQCRKLAEAVNLSAQFGGGNGCQLYFNGHWVNSNSYEDVFNVYP